MALAQPNVLNFASDIRYPAVLIQLERQLQSIAAGQRADLADPVRIFHFPDVTGIEKMVLELFRIFPHGFASLILCIIYRYSRRGGNLYTSKILLLTGFQRLFKISYYIIDVLCAD